MAASVGILFVDGASQHLNGAHKQRQVLLGGALQVLYELFEFLGHDVESFRQFADLGAAFQVDSLREISARDRTARLGEDLKGISDASRGEDAKSHADQYGEKRQQPASALHFVNPAIGFVARLLHDDRPVQRRHRTVSTEHGGASPAIANIEFLGGRELRLIALVDKIVDDLQVFHVLPSRVIGRGSGHKASLAVYDIRGQTTAADLLEAANEELQVNH